MLISDTGVFHHVVARGGMGAIGSYEKVEIYGYFGCSRLPFLRRAILGWILSVVFYGCLVMLFKPSRFLVEVRTGKFVVEVQRYVGHFLERIEEAFIKTCAVHRFDVLEIISDFGTIFLRSRNVLGRVHHRPEILRKARQSFSVRGSCGHAWVWFPGEYCQEDHPGRHVSLH